MKKYIECDAAYRFAQDQLKKETGAYSKGWNNALGVMKSAFHNNDAIPAADVVVRDCYDRLLAENDELRKERPVHHGRWTRVDYEPIGHDYICSVCKCKNDRASQYCPDCGAHMNGGDGDV